MTPREAGIQAFYADEGTTNTLQGLNAAFDAYEATNDVSDEMVAAAHKAMMAELFWRCQPKWGDVFAFMDDRKDVVRIALQAAIFQTKAEA